MGQNKKIKKKSDAVVVVISYCVLRQSEILHGGTSQSESQSRGCRHASDFGQGASLPTLMPRFALSLRFIMRRLVSHSSSHSDECHNHES